MLPSTPPPPRKRPQQERSRITVEAILEAAFQVLASGGYDALTTTRVAERAGVSVGTLYQYFPDKAALVSGLVEAWLAQKRAAMAHAFEHARTQPLAEAAAHLVGAFADALGGGDNAALALGGVYVGWQQALDAELSAMVEAAADLLRQRPREAPPGDPALVAFVAVHAATALVIRGTLDRPADLASGALAREATALVQAYLARASEASGDPDSNAPASGARGEMDGP